MDGDFGDGQGIASATWTELLPLNGKMTGWPVSLET